MARTNEHNHQDRSCGLSFMAALALSWERIWASSSTFTTVITEAILRCAKTTYLRRDVIVFVFGIFILTEYLPKRIHRHCLMCWKPCALSTKLTHMLKLICYLGLYAIGLQIFVYWTVFKMQSLGALDSSSKNMEQPSPPEHSGKQNIQKAYKTTLEEDEPESEIEYA